MNEQGKICSKCKQWKPFDCFSPNKKMTLGYGSRCKECVAKEARERYTANKEKLQERSRQWRKNNPEKHKESLRGTYARHYKNNAEFQEANRQRAAEYRKSNPEKVKAAQKRYTPEQTKQWREKYAPERREKRREEYAQNPEYFREVAQKWRRENLEKAKEVSKQSRARNKQEVQRRTAEWREKNQDHVRQYGENYRIENAERIKEWWKKNKAKRITYKLIRKQREALAQGSFTSDEWEALCSFYENCCLCCGKVAPLTVDHIVPISRGGDNTINNIQPLCGPCNSRKNAKTIDYRKA